MVIKIINILHPHFINHSHDIFPKKNKYIVLKNIKTLLFIKEKLNLQFFYIEILTYLELIGVKSKN